MGTFNGAISSLTKGTSTGGEFAVFTGVSYSQILSAVPMKIFESALFGTRSSGVSGSVYVSVVCSVGGATAVFAEGNVAANGSLILGNTTALVAVPRPIYVGYSSTTASSGFTTSVTMMGVY